MTPEERAQFERRMAELLKHVETKAIDRVQQLGQKLKAVEEFETLFPSNPNTASEDSDENEHGTA